MAQVHPRRTSEGEQPARPRRVRKPPAPSASSAAVLETTAPVAEAVPTEVAPEWRGLLGQPVGLRLDGVSRTFRAGVQEIHALRDVSLEIAPGEFVAIVGPSGCGKSTLLSLLGGLDMPTAGRVFAAGVALDDLSGDALADYRLQRIGTIFQTFNLFPSLTATDNVALPLALSGVKLDQRGERATRLLELVGMDHRARFRPPQMSGGEQQRVAVARSLALRPGVILADEPTGSLDSVAGASVLSLLEDLHRRGATLVVVTHDPEVARRAKRVVRMRDGALVADSGGGRRTGRAPLGLESPARLSSADTMLLGFEAAGRRPLRTALTATGGALGMALTALALSLGPILGRGALFLAGLAVLLAVFGIVNTMFTAVVDRTREVGILKALGARLRDVAILFVAESAGIGLVSALLGLAFIALAVALGNRVTDGQTFVVSGALEAVVFVLTIVLSAASGVIPAIRASLLDPARALRHE